MRRSTRDFLLGLLSAATVAMPMLGVAAPPAAGVASVRVERRPLPQSLAAEATLEAVRAATLAAQTSGRVVDLRVDAGDRVAAGAVLLRLDAAEAAQAVAGAEAGVARAEADLINARAELERTRSLFQRKFVSQAALDRAEAALQSAQAQSRAARAGRGEAAVVKGYATLAAPFAGVVAARHVERGEMAQPGAPLLTLYDPSAMRALVDLPQYRLAQLDGAKLRACVELPESGRWIDAAAVIPLPAADARTHTVRVRVELPRDTPGLVPGMFARVHFVSSEATKLVVPAQAILRRGELTAVYVADGRGGFVLRQVRVGETEDGGVEILAGLAGGEDVALDPVRAGILARAGGGH